MFYRIDEDNSKELVANVNSRFFLGQIYVSESDLNDYVEFTIVDIQQDDSKIPAFWYGDRKEDSIEEITDNLNKGLMLLLGNSRS